MKLPREYSSQHAPGIRFPGMLTIQAFFGIILGLARALCPFAYLKGETYQRNKLSSK